MNGARLLGRYLNASWKAHLEYPGSVLMLTVGQFVGNVIEVVAIWALFARFGSLDGWRFGDAVMFYGVLSLSFSVADFFTRGFDMLGASFIRTGDLDRLLVRPRTLTVQLIGWDFRLSRAGRFGQAALAIVIATRSLDFQWTPGALAFAIWIVSGGVALFVALMILQGAVSFWTIDGLEMMNVLTYGGVQAAQYPLSIYTKWLRDFLIFVVPVGCVSYFPVLALLGKPDPLGAPDWLLPLTPIAGFIFLGLSFLAWRAGVAKYTSTGS